MEFYDTTTQTFPRIPSQFIYDENGRKMYQIGAPTYNQPGLGFSWSEDNLKEVEMGIIKKAETLEEIAKITDTDPVALKETLDRWNAKFDAGKDDDLNLLFFRFVKFFEKFLKLLVRIEGYESVIEFRILEPHDFDFTLQVFRVDAAFSSSARFATCLIMFLFHVTRPLLYSVKVPVEVPSLF